MIGPRRQTWLEGRLTAELSPPNVWSDFGKLSRTPHRRCGVTSILWPRVAKFASFLDRLRHLFREEELAR